MTLPATLPAVLAQLAAVVDPPLFTAAVAPAAQPPRYLLQPVAVDAQGTLAIAELYGRVVRGQEDRYKDWCELVHSG